MSNPASTPAAPPSAPVTPSPAPIIGPSSPPGVVAPLAPAATGPTRDLRGRFAEGSADATQRPQRTLVEPKKAFRQGQTVGSDVDKMIADTRTRMNMDKQDVERPTAPTAPAPVIPDLEAAPDPATPAAPAPPKPSKVKIGDKEYTSEELAAHMAELAELKKPAGPAPAAPTPARPAVAPPTAAEIAQLESEFVATTSAALDAPLTEAEHDLILEGGAPAVAAMQTMRKRDMATAILHARKGIAEGLNPVLQEIFSKLGPVLAQHENLQRYQITQQFAQAHPEFIPHHDLATSVAEELIRRYPTETDAMSAEQFIAEVARQTDVQLTNSFKRFNPGSDGNWRAAGAVPAPPAPPVPPVVPVPPLPAPAPPPQPVRTLPPAVGFPIPTARPGPRPLVGVIPGAAPGGAAPDWNTQVARGLRR